MHINTRTFSDITVVEVVGDIDGASAPTAQAQLLPHIQPLCKLVLDMSAVGYMSSAGLRMMLLVFRQTAGAGGQLALTGLSEDIKDTMSLTGFLDFFSTFDTVDAGVEALQA